MKVNVYEQRPDFWNDYEYGDVIARVNYNDNLDYWNGSNWQNGGTGMHKGLTKLRDGRYVLIIGTQWQGDRHRAYVITAEEALQEVLESDNMELLDNPRFKSLKALYNAMPQEMEDEAHA